MLGFICMWFFPSSTTLHKKFTMYSRRKVSNEHTAQINSFAQHVSVCNGDLCFFLMEIIAIGCSAAG